MSSLAPVLPANRAAPRQLQLPQLSPNTIVTVTLAACVAAGVLMAYDFRLAIGLLVGLCYLPLVLVNLPLGIALWVPSTFLTGLPGFDSASHAAGLVIALAWFGQLRAHASEQGRHVPRGLLLLAALFIIWLALSMLWAERPGSSFAALSPFIAAALMFTVLLTLDLTAKQIRLIAFSFIAGVTFSVAIGLIGGVKPPTGDSAIGDDGRLRGGLDDPNYLAAGIVPSIVMAAGLVPGLKNVAWRIALAGMCVILLLGLAATESRGGLLAAIVATLASVVVAKRSRAVVVALIAIGIGCVAIYFASTPDAWNRVTHTADKGNGRSSLWIVAGRIWKDHPVVGVGLDNYRAYAPRYVSGPGQLTFVNFIAERPHVVHNVYLQTLVEVGLIGLGLFLAVILSSLAAALRAARRFEARGDFETSALARSVFVGLLAALVASFFISNANGLQIWVLLAFGPMLLRLAKRQEDPVEVPPAAPLPAAPPLVTPRAPALRA
ncbi:MAG: O-antigen ligase family protein [Thermoleophilaceae bacterium]|nr:O-antigen ligase family protein [Thermoleophilaceae bacterium]